MNLIRKNKMKALAISTVLLLTLGLSACSKDQAENTAPVDNTAVDETEVVDPATVHEDAQPLDAAPLETDELASSEAVAE